MAVELLITNQKTKTRELVPVATSEVFRNYWKVGCNELQLSAVPLIEDGLFVRGDIPSLIKELGLLKQWFQKTQVSKTSDALLIRVDNVVKALERVLNDSNLMIG